jgi:hypothetical protein
MAVRAKADPTYEKANGLLRNEREARQHPDRGRAIARRKGPTLPRQVQGR